MHAGHLLSSFGPTNFNFFASFLSLNCFVVFITISFDMTITSIYDQLVHFIIRNLIGGKPIDFDESEESDTAASNFHTADHLQSPVQI